MTEKLEEEFEVVKPVFQNQQSEPNGYAKLHKRQFIKPPVVSSKPPPKPQSIISGQTQTTHRSRVDSEKRQALLKSDILSKEEEAKIAKEKKDKLDEIKKKYSQKAPRNKSQNGSRAGS